MAAIGLMADGAGALTIVGGTLWLAATAWTVGTVAVPDESRGLRFALGLLGAAALWTVLGAAVYQAYKLDEGALSGLLVLLPWLAFAVSPLLTLRRPPERVPSEVVEKTAPTDSASAVLLALALAADAAALRWLQGARTGEAIRSPWEVVPPIFFLWLTLAAFCLLALAFRRRYPHLTLAALAFHLFVTLAPAAVVYRLGYGFDGFIHAAAEKLIAAAGVVTPKTPYYIGQYSLVTLIAKLWHLPVAAVDRWLLPVFASLSLPLAAAWTLRRGFGVERGLAVLSTTGLLLLPLAPFVATTPQGLADLFALLAVLSGTAWLHAHRPPLAYVLLLAAAALATHPLAGIPAAAFCLFLMFFKLKGAPHLAGLAGKALLFTALFALAAASVPWAFLFGGGAPQEPAAVVATLRKPLPELLSRIPAETPGVDTRYKPALDFAELVDRNQEFLLLLLAGAGAWLLGRKKGYRRTVFAVIGTVSALLVAVILLRGGLTFRDVIAYEQTEYGDRLYEVAVLTAAPLALAAIALFWRAASRTDGGVRLTLTIIFAAATAALAYAAFPRVDDYRLDRGYSTSVHDVEAVRWINGTASGPYVVLANQAVSAAALREYGFKTYYGDQFYYPIPTGAPLYRSYLEMVYDGPSRETMRAAMRSVGVPTAYFVVNRYWTGSARLVEQAKTTADDWHEVDGGEVFVFRYALNPAR